MPAVASTHLFALSLELTLIFAGLVLLWRLVLCPAARALRAPSPLAPWESPLADFLLFLWIVICGGLMLPLLTQQLLRFVTLAEPAKLMLVNAAFQGGMLAGIVVFHRGVHRRTPRPPVAFASALLPGAATFLLSLPLVVLVGLAWAGLLKLCGLPVEPQDAVALFAKTRSPVLLALLIALATLVAPITEELIFRAGIFGYVRTRLPRWAALLLPAVLFAALHNHLASFAPLVVLGILFALAYERTGRIAVPIVAHALFNLYSIVRLFLDPPAT